jgi:hypothetical protein
MKSKQSLEDKHRIAEEIVGVPIEWESDVRGFFECPMKDSHTTPTVRLPGAIRIMGAFNTYCGLQRGLPSLIDCLP